MSRKPDRAFFSCLWARIIKKARGEGRERGGKRGEERRRKRRKEEEIRPMITCRRSFRILSRSLIPSRARSEISFERDLKRDLSKNGVSQSLEHDVSR